MKKTTSTRTAFATVWCAVLAAGVLLLAGTGDQFSDWSDPINLGPTINTPSFDVGASISRDGLSLYFGSAGHGGFGGLDIFVVRRATHEAPWGPPQNLGSNVNTSFNDQAPSLSVDGHRLYFQSDRPGGFGGSDLYVSRRYNQRTDVAWQHAENLGALVNSSSNDAASAAPFEDEGTGETTLYFTSDRPGGFGGDDIYMSRLQPDEIFGQAELVEALSSPFQDRQPGIRRDGLEIFLTSSRPPTFGLTDIWVATRPSNAQPWSAPANLGPTVNSAGNDGRPALSFMGTELYFQSTGRGGFGGQDLYVTTREKLKNPNED
jgi:hypothetical protein